MTELRSYRTLMSDSSRWEHFTHRPGDIIISTPPKCGTTWTQMLCALLIFDGAEFPGTIDGMSPWLDMLIRSQDEVFEIYERQAHRRFIKTHTPLDGIPEWDDVTYIVVGRDPRDALISSEHHGKNIDFKAIMGHRANAVGNDDLANRPKPSAPDPDPRNRFRTFVESDDPGLGPSLSRVLHHLQTGWDRSDRPNVGLFHYADYQRDLVSEMSGLAEQLGITTSRSRISDLAPEAGIDAMRDRADELAPDTTKSPWKDARRFFRNGASGEWIERTDDAMRSRYDERVHGLVTPELAAWIHHGRNA